MQANICPHLNKFKMSECRYDDFFSRLTEYEFKLENIYSSCGRLFGYEILLDFEKAEMSASTFHYKKSICDASAIECVINKLLAMKSNFSGRKLFVNFERLHLCHRQLLSKVAFLSKELSYNKVELVLEITERNECGSCEQIRNGLSYLKSAGVTLAVDDFDIYGGDYRVAEVLSGVYDYVKVEAPTTASQRCKFNKFASLNFMKNKKIIMERVECTTLLQGLAVPFGLQGYAYGRSAWPQ